MTTWVTESLPLPVIGTVGSMVSLQSILADEFGADFSVSTGYWLTYEGASFLQEYDLSYWNPATPLVTSWYVNGQNIGPDFVNQTHVPLSQVDAADLLIGNDIGPYIYLTFPVSIPPTTYAVNVQYQFAVVPPNLVSPTIASGIVNPADIVASAERYAAEYSGTPNPNDCSNICYDLASAAGAALPIPFGLDDPTQNVDGGFWRIVYRGSDPNPVANWQTLVQAGDMVRMVWANGGHHMTTVLSVNPNGSITVFDNSASATGMIGIHTVNYDTKTVPSSITIYRLTPDHLYLIDGVQGETLIGSPFNNEFNAVDGDVVNCGPKNDVVNLGSGTIAVNGGAANDTVVFSSLSSVNANITDSTGSALRIINDTIFDHPGRPVTISWSGGVDTLSAVSTVQFVDQSFSIVTPPPTTISSISALADSWVAYATTGHLVTITVSLSAPITVGGIPTLQLSDNEVANFIGGSGTDALTFTYAVQANDNTIDLQVTGLNLPGNASIIDYFGNAVVGSFSADLSVQVNTPFAPIAEQIGEIYRADLQRAPTNAQVESQLSLAFNVGSAAVVAAVVDSPEAQHNVYPIAQIINLANGSLPTAAQLAGWLPFIESAGLLQGSSQANPLLDQMALAFVASSVFGNTYNGGTAVNPNAPITASVVSAIIQAATGVAATQTQVNTWVATGMTIDQVFVFFALGDQYSAHIQSTVQQYLTTLADQAASNGGLGVGSTVIPHDVLTAGQVQAFYQSALQRFPNSAEVNAALSIDSTIGNIGALAAIVDSPEAQQNVYPVTQVILLATGNVPTPAQLAGWVPAVESGTSLDNMALAFVASTAFGNTYDGGTAVNPNAPITASIMADIIQAATGIAAAQTQINAWLATGETIDQVFVSFALGDQYSAHIQSTVQAYLDATAINAAGLTTVDAVNATGALALGTTATPLTGNDLTVLGGSGALTLVATGTGDTITELNTSAAGGTITANGNGDTITAANGTNTITANGSGDTISLGVVSTGTAISTVQTIHASGAGDTISFAIKAADGTAVTWTAPSTVDGGSATTGVGANSTVNFGNNTGSGSEAIVVTGDLTGVTTQSGTSTTGIAMITLANVHDAAGDQIVFNNATTEVLAGSVNVSSATSLAHAFDMAAADAAASQSGGKIAANTGVIDWFQYGGNTYLVEAINATTSAAAHNALSATDEMIKIIGSVSLTNESLTAHVLTL
jgi:hypothetical protein